MSDKAMRSTPREIPISEQGREREVRWLWKNRIPCGMSTTIDGDPGHGKSMLTVFLASTVSSGSAWPDGAPCQKGSVVMLNGEDPRDEVLKPRLVAAGADQAKIYRYDGHILPQSLGSLEDIMTRIGDVRLLIIDPVTSFIDSQINQNNASQIRQKVLDPLAAMADRLDIAIVIVRHFNKSYDGKAIQRGAGSMGMIGQARMGYVVVKRDDDSGLRDVAPVKCNVGKEPNSFAFDVTGKQVEVEGADGAPKKVPVGCFRWQGDTRVKADDLIKQHSSGTSDYDRGMQLLSELLGAGNKTVEEIVTAAEQRGISPRTMKRVRLDAKSRGLAERYKKPGVKDGPWFWQLVQSGSDRALTVEAPLNETEEGFDGTVPGSTNLNLNIYQ